MMDGAGRATKTFGRRGASPQPARAARRDEAASPAPSRSTLDSVLRAALPEASGAPLEALWLSFFKACVVAFATSVMVSSLFIGPSNAPGGFGGQLFINLASAAAMMSFAPILVIPVRVLADVARLARLPRGASDIAIGGLCGSLMMAPDLAAGAPVKPMAWAFVLGGLFGGFTFWRSRGYPALDDMGRRYAEALHRTLDRLRGRA